MYYNPLLYQHYRFWYHPWPKYRRIKQELPKLPKIAKETSFENINQQLQLLRAQHETARLTHGVDIAPDPVNGRFIWVKPVQ